MAAAAVSAIEKYNGRTLTKKLRKTIDDYSIEMLGSKYYAPWIYVYASMKKEFHEGWIPDNFFGYQVVPKINGELFRISDIKTISKLFLDTEALPDIGYYIDGIMYDRDFSMLTAHEFRTVIFQNSDVVFLKKNGSESGGGVTKVGRENTSEDTFLGVENYVVQSCIDQHSFFERMISGPVATLRITTVRERDGRIEIRAAYLRLGRKNESHVQSATAVKIAIVDENGKLDVFGYTPDWRRTEYHPDTGVQFANNYVPNFRKAVDLCIELHRKIPHVTIIGWDTAIDKNDQVRIMEWNNGHCDIKFSEAIIGPCFLGLDWEEYREH